MLFLRRYKNLLLSSYKVVKKLKIANKKISTIKLACLSFLSYLLELISLGSIIPLIFLIIRISISWLYYSIDFLNLKKR